MTSLSGSEFDQFATSSDDTRSQTSNSSLAQVHSIARSISPWILNEEQSRGFQFFHLQTVPNLSRFNHAADSFYGRCLPAMAATDDLVRSMSITVGLFHLECVRAIPFETTTAIKEYGHSLRHLSRSSGSDRIVVLTACLLFISMEMLRGRFHRAMMHVQRGMDILAHTGCDGSKYRFEDPLSSLELRCLRVIISQIAEIAGLLNFVREDKFLPEQMELPELEKEIEDYAEARLGSRKLARYCTSVGVDTEFTQSLWQIWHIRVDSIMAKLLANSGTGVIDVPLLL